MYVFEDGESKFGVILIETNFAIKLCFNSFFRFLEGKLRSIIGSEGLNKISKQKYFGVV